MRNVPKLRFKEFTDEWEKLNAEEIFKNVSNKNHNGDLPILAVTQDKGVVYRDSLDLTINSSEKGIKSYKIIEPGDFIISLRSFQGGIEYSNLLGISSPAYTVLKSKIRICDSFYKFYLKKESFISELNSTIEGIRDGKQISYSMFSKLKLPYTTFKEQEKIGNFLLSIDKKISITEEKLNLFNDYKKGIMQKIFNQELRFKDESGNNYPEWEEKKLEDIVNISKGKQLNKESLSEEEKYPVINGGILPSGYTNTYNFLANTITISEGGNSCGYVNFIKNDFWASGHCYTVEKKRDIHYKYLYHVLKNNETNIMELRVGSGLPNIQKKAINNYKVTISICKEEQQKIADFLSAIDSKIEKISDELENLKEFKKGLLQQMFV